MNDWKIFGNLVYFYRNRFRDEEYEEDDDEDDENH
jgi:hypothetical protein